MSQYQRIVSYVYRYVRGEKRENTGYVRVQQRDHKVQVTVKLQRGNMTNLPKVYFFIQRDWGMECVPGGILQDTGNELELRIDTLMEDLLGSGQSLHSMDGMVLIDNESNYYATAWTDKVVYMGKMKIYGKEEQEKKPEITVDREEKTEMSVEREKKGEMAPEKEEEALEMEVQSVCSQCPVRNPKTDFGIRMLHLFPSMSPFAYSCVKQCVRIEPKDIGCLPTPAWAIAGNKFLLHGYYCYRHLLFAQGNQGGYYIGVPGVYTGKDAQQAQQFGFMEFYPLSKEERRGGAFGYWMMKLKENQINFDHVVTPCYDRNML